MESNNVAYNNAIFKFGPLGTILRWTPLTIGKACPIIFYLTKRIPPLRNCFSFKIEDTEKFEELKATLGQCYSLETGFEELQNLTVPVYITIPIITFTKREVDEDRFHIGQSNTNDFVNQRSKFIYFESVYYFARETTPEAFKAELTRSTDLQYFQLDQLPVPQFIIDGNEMESICQNCKYNKDGTNNMLTCLLYTNIFDCILNNSMEREQQEVEQ